MIGLQEGDFIQNVLSRKVYEVLLTEVYAEDKKQEGIIVRCVLSGQKDWLSNHLVIVYSGAFAGVKNGRFGYVKIEKEDVPLEVLQQI